MHTYSVQLPTIPTFVITPQIQQRLHQHHHHVHYHLPPAAPANYGQAAFPVAPPSLERSGAPAGRGVTGAPKDEGWPKNSFRTAGGYTVVFDGKSQSMKVYGPGQSPKDKPKFKVWGDPHVHESDGTKWDFTKDGDMVLPDGTLLSLDTTSETGRSYLERVNIVNGSDRVEITGISKDRPKAGFIRPDGYAWRARHLARTAGKEYKTFVMGGRRSEDVTFNLFVRGVDQGEITGARYDGKQRAYVQETDGGHLYQPDAELLPPLGSPAWGNAVRSMTLDMLVRGNPQAHAQYASYFSLRRFLLALVRAPAGSAACTAALVRCRAA